jgi:predicted amidohydrolase YtcJ
MTGLLLRNARIWMGVSGAPWAEAALVRDGRFAFVGSAHEIDAPSDCETLDAGGRLVLPGLIDAHVHLLNTGLAMRSVDLKGVASSEEAVRRVAERLASTAAGGWVRGAGWDQHLWPEARFPTRHELDAVAPEYPVVLIHTSGHCLWVNSAALRAAGIDANTHAPEGGAIDREHDGTPSGILRDEAMRLVYRVMPAPSRAERLAAVRDAVARAHSLGLTGVHAMDVGRGELLALQSLRDEGALTLRVTSYLSAERLEEWVEEFGQGADRPKPVPQVPHETLRVAGVKFFADGALGSLTAWLLEPHEGTDDRGLALQPVEELEARVRRCLQHGLAPAVHAIGDRANREVLDLLERAQDLAPELPRRIEHAQLLTEADIPRFGALGVAASVQPIHATQDMSKVERHWGARGKYAYAFRSLLDSGARLAFGSDSPVETIDPIAGIHAAVTRRTAAGEPAKGWYPEQRLSLEEALEAYTSSAAAAAGQSDRYGKIAPGYAGDFVVVSDDIFALEDPMRILNARVEMTVAGGKVVYRRA